MATGEPSITRERALNLPAPITALAALLIAFHAIVVLGPIEWRVFAIGNFAFLPLRLVVSDGGPQAAWMWLSYAFLHGDWLHLGMNVLWLAVFGSPVLRRIGSGRFALLSVAGALGAVGLHAAVHWGSPVPVIGYSGVVSALTGAAVRFAFGPVRFDPQRFEAASRMSIVQTLTNRTSLTFVAIWMVANILAGSGVLAPGGARIAWEAHIGGFVTGLVLFGLFDHQRPASTNESSEPSEPIDR